MRSAWFGLPGAVLAGWLVVGCGGGGFELEEIDSLPEAVPLNQPIVLRFSHEVLAASVTPETVRVRSEDTGEPVPGTLRVIGRRVEFLPALPCRPDLADSGLRPGHGYVLEVPGLPRSRVIRSRDGDRLAQGTRRRFRTVAEGADVRLFRDPGSGARGPRVVLEPRPALDAGSGEITLEFDEPLDPRSLAEAEILLRFPWSPDSDPGLPRFTLELEENGLRALVRLRLVTTDGPQPLNPGEEGYQLEVRRAGLKDLGGETWSASPRIDICVQQGNPGRDSERPAPREGTGQ